MAKLNIVELQSFEVADVDPEGGIPTSGFSPAFGMKEGTSNINVAEPSSNDYYVEESSLPFASTEGNREADFTVELIGVESSQLAELLGGTYTAATSSDPESITLESGAAAVYKALKLTGKNGDGEDVTIFIPKARILASFTGTIGRGDIRGWAIKGKILVPLNSSGVPQPYLRIDTGSPNS